MRQQEGERRNGELKIFACSSGEIMTAGICRHLGIEPGRILVSRFGDGEVRVEIREDVRGSDCFVVGSLSTPADYFEMVLLSRALRGSSAGRITMVPAYLGYQRQNRKDKPRVPISATIANELLMVGNPHRILLLDIHDEGKAGDFDSRGVVVDQLYASYAVVDYLRSLICQPARTKIASPDKGGVARARAYNRILNLGDFVVFDKGEHPEPGALDENQIMIIGEVEGHDLIFVDDMIDSATTVVKDARAAKRKGAGRIIVFATHGLFSGEAIKRLDSSDIEEVIITDTVFHPGDRLITQRVKITTVTVAVLLARAVGNIHREESLSQFFL